MLEGKNSPIIPCVGAHQQLTREHAGLTYIESLAGACFSQPGAAALPTLHAVASTRAPPPCTCPILAAPPSAPPGAATFGGELCWRAKAVRLYRARMLVLSRYSLPLARPRKTLTPLTHQNALRTAVLPAYPPVGAAVFVGAAAQPKRRGKGACSGFALDQTRQLRTCFRARAVSCSCTKF